MEELFQYFKITEVFMMIALAISGLLSFIPQYKLMKYLKEHLVERWA